MLSTDPSLACRLLDIDDYMGITENRGGGYEWEELAIGAAGSTKLAPGRPRK